MKPGVALALLLAAPGAAREATPVTPAEQAAVDRAIARGRLIYACDRAAWHGTDDLLAKLPNAADRVAGYVVDGPADAARLIFYSKDGSKAVYVARFEDARLVDGRILPDDDSAALEPIDRRMIAALATARKALLADRTVFACADKPFNTVVLPPERPDGPIAVYFLTPQTSNDAVPFGGHYEVDVDAGGHAGAVRAFSKSCVPAPTRQPLPAGAKPSLFVITHLLDPVPTEVHVFSSLALKLPVGVVTNAPTPRIWVVGAGRIEPPRPLDPR